MGEYFSFTFIDSQGRTTSKRIEVEPQTLLGDYATLAAAIADDLEAVTDLGLVSCSVTIPIAESFAVTAASNIDVGATFSGYIAGGLGKKASWKLPGIKMALTDGVGGVPITQADVEDVLERFLTGAGDLMLSDGEQISEWLSGSLDK